MAVGVKAPKDTKEYKEKAIVDMALKQLFCLSIVVGVNIVINLIFIVWLKILMEITSWLMIPLLIPIVSLGWFKRNGLAFEVYIKQFSKCHFSFGIRRKQGASMKEEKKVAETANVETDKDTGGQET